MLFRECWRYAPFGCSVKDRCWKALKCIWIWYWYITKINIINIFSIYPLCDFGAFMLSTISNSQKKKVPDVRAIVTLLLLISHWTFIRISLGYNVLLDPIFFVYTLMLFWTRCSECEQLRGNFHKFAMNLVCAINVTTIRFVGCIFLYYHFDL